MDAPGEEAREGRPGAGPILLRVLALLLSTAFSLALAELAFRVTWTPPSLRTTPMNAAHPVYGFAPLPGVRGTHVTSEYEHGFEHTAQRFRGEHEVSARAPASTQQRVLFLGDSFTYGLGAENSETFVSRVGAALPGVEVLNGGCNGYGTRHALSVLHHAGAAFEPDLAVLMFFWNDLSDNVKRSEPAFELDSDGQLNQIRPIVRGFDPLARYPTPDFSARTVGSWKTSYLGRYFKEGMKGLRYRFFGSKARFIENETQRDEAWEVAERLLGLAAGRAEALGSELIVVSIPDHNRVDPAAVNPSIRPLHFDVEERLAQISGALGIPYVDLHTPLKQAWQRNASTPLYYFADRHLTPRGNAVVAEALVPVLQAALAARAAER